MCIALTCCKGRSSTFYQWCCLICKGANHWWFHKSTVEFAHVSTANIAHYMTFSYCTCVAIAFGRSAESMSTFVDDMFGGTQVSSVICHRCHTVCHYVIQYVIMLYCMSLCYTVCHYVTLYVIMSHCMSLCYTVCHYVTLYVIIVIVSYHTQYILHHNTCGTTLM